ncbi:hypothetical protein ACFPJ1_00655 [Kribbella qitaiheensis]|uniref:hypothetical protein n=1 Tax=Kribbella qitaiheensis TaxID=1544730 RepID=UPI00360C08F9
MATAKELVADGIDARGPAQGHGRTIHGGATVAVRLATLTPDGPTGELHAEPGRLPW